jgi:molybdopterin synthase sulfurtransferase
LDNGFARGELRAHAGRPLGTVDTADLRDRLGDSGVSIVDARPMAAYNGWPLRGEARGGHIPGAAAFPPAWLGGLEETEIRNRFRAKGITTDRSVVVYGDGVDDAASLAEALTALGYRQVRIYADGFPAWAADPSVPVERLPNYQRLVHAAWLRELLDRKRPSTEAVSDHALFHVNFQRPEEYEESHVPGALHLDTNQLEDPADWNRRPPDQLRANLLELGITSKTTVVLYGRDAAGDSDAKWAGQHIGQTAAARAALILSYAGVRDVRLLDGGYDAWVAAGNPIEQGVRVPRPASDFGAAIPSRPEMIIDIDEVRSILPAEDAVLVSVRNRREQTGSTSGYGYIEEVGRIAGDVWGGGGPDENYPQPHRNVDNTLRAYPEVASRWRAAGVTPDKRVAFYCGTGWRASEAWFQAFLMAPRGFAPSGYLVAVWLYSGGGGIRTHEGPKGP